MVAFTAQKMGYVGPPPGGRGALKGHEAVVEEAVVEEAVAEEAVAEEAVAEEAAAEEAVVEEAAVATGIRTPPRGGSLLQLLQLLLLQLLLLQLLLLQLLLLQLLLGEQRKLTLVLQGVVVSRMVVR